MPMHFVWRPSNSPTQADRPDIGLELGGDDATLGAATAGRVKLYEVAGTGAGRAANEETAARLLATFHGTFHRDPSALVARRITFEIELGGSSGDPHYGEVLGFDPECILGVDCLVLTFVNREFQVYFPFFIDTRSEAAKLEIQAVAEFDGGHAEVRSPVLNLRNQRTHEIETTSASPSGSGQMRYTGKVVGNIILHHEEYLVQGLFWQANQAAPTGTQSAVVIPIRTGGLHPLPFAPYQTGAFRVVLMTDMLDQMVPSQSDLDAGFRNSTIQTPRATAVRSGVAAATRRTLQEIFEDAGFAGITVLWSDDSAATSDATAYSGAFRDGVLRNSTRPLTVPFWTFYAGFSTQVTQAVAHAEERVTNHTHTHGPRRYMLPHPLPIGSGDKQLVKPAQVRSSYFRERLASPPPAPRRRPRGAPQAPAPDYNLKLRGAAAKLAITIAHEIAHGLGMMHDILIQNSGPYDESSASPLMSIMSSGIETESFGMDMKFSHQAKVVWANAYGVTPNWTNTYLLNKTWGTNWRTIDWGTRRQIFFDLHQETSMARPGVLTLLGTPPPFAGTGANVQRGTYVP